LKTLDILPALGFDIWKTREIANLILARKKMRNHNMRCNIMFNFNNTANITLESDQVNETELESLAEEICNTISA